MHYLRIRNKGLLGMWRVTHLKHFPNLLLLFFKGWFKFCSWGLKWWTQWHHQRWSVEQKKEILTCCLLTLSGCLAPAAMFTVWTKVSFYMPTTCYHPDPLHKSLAVSIGSMRGSRCEERSQRVKPFVTQSQQLSVRQSIHTEPICPNSKLWINASMYFP